MRTIGARRLPWGVLWERRRVSARINLIHFDREGERVLERETMRFSRDQS